MRHVTNFSDFSVNEAIKNISSDWPANWREMPEWTRLHELCFVDSTTPQMERNGNILLTNPQLPLYPGGITLQQSGYIRNKLATSGFVRKYERGFTLKEMFDYLINRFSKVSTKAALTSTESGLPASAVILLDKITNKSWKLNTATQRIDVNGNVYMSGVKHIPEGIRFGVVSGSFDCENCGLPDLEIAPTLVGKSFDCSRNPIKSLEGCPESVGGNFVCEGTKIVNMEGAPVTVGGYINAKSCKNLESLEGMPLNIMGIYTDYFNIIIEQYTRSGDPISISQEGKIDTFMNALQKAMEAVGIGPSYTPERKFIDNKSYHIRVSQVCSSDANKTKALRLIASVADEKYLDAYFTKNPLKLYLLDNSPEIKNGVLARTGMRDMGKIGRSLDKGII